MSEKKYIDFTALGHYDAKIKSLIDTKDEAVLGSAKSYADGLAKNYEPSGAANTALNAANAYTDEKAGELTTTINAVDTKAQKGVDDAAAAQNAANAVQADVDALKTYVGTIPEGATATNVIAYVQEKTAGIATDAALEELTNRVTAAEGDIDAIQDDYLKAVDKTELQGNIDVVDGKVDTLVGADTDKSVRTIANEELAAQLIPENAKESLDTLQEIAAWIQAHPDDAATMNAAIGALETLVGEIPADATATDIVAYIKEVVDAEKARAEKAEGDLADRVSDVEAKFGEGEGSVADMIADAVKTEKEAREAADSALAGDIATAQAAAEAAKGAVDALETEVAKKAAQTDLDALTGKVTTAESKITALEGASHTHANKTVLDDITAEYVASWDDAATKAHTHTNKSVLDEITAIKTAAWDAAEANAKAYTDEKIGEFVAITTDEIDTLFA